MTAQTPDEWLLNDFDHRASGSTRHPSITNHVRPMFEVLPDVPTRRDGSPMMTGSAQWPKPHIHHDLDALDEAERRRADFRAARNQQGGAAA